MTPNNKHKRKLRKIQNQLWRLDTREEREIEKLTNRFSEQDENFDPEQEWEHAGSEYVFELSEIWAKNDNKRKKLDAEFVATHLIAYHIVRPNEILHGDDLEATLKRWLSPKTAKKISSIIDNSQYYPLILNEYPYVHLTLWQKYRVKLLDKNYARYLLLQQKELHKQIYFCDVNDYRTKLQKALDDNVAELNRFHDAVLKKIYEENKQQDRPF
jgi:hypothetical protein